MLTNLVFVFICVRASSALVRTSAFLQPVVRGQVYIFEISPPLNVRDSSIMIEANQNAHRIPELCPETFFNKCIILTPWGFNKKPTKI